MNKLSTKEWKLAAKNVKTFAKLLIKVAPHLCPHQCGIIMAYLLQNMSRDCDMINCPHAK